MSPGKVVLGVAAIVGGGLTLWRGAQEYAEFRILGAPAWWVLWRRPLEGAATPPPNSRAGEYLHATQTFRWDKDRWVPLSKPSYGTTIPANRTKGGAPSGRSLYGQVWWMSKDGGWRRTKVLYGRDVSR